MTYVRSSLFVLALLLSIVVTACTSASPTATPSPALTPPPEEPIVVDRVEVVVLESFPVQVHAVIQGTLSDACAFIEQADQFRRGDVFEVTLTPAWQANARCAPNPTPFEHTVPLDVIGLPAGTYVVEAHGAHATFALDVPNIPLEPATISGRVWHDLCGVTGGEGGVPASPSEGCIPETGGGYRANGLMEQGEPGIEGILVSLGQGECPSVGLQTALTDADGVYAFPDLDAGTYCVSVDPLQEPNTSILVPGGWTAPNDRGAVAVVLGPGAQRMDVDLGWDYQFLPADALAEFETRLVQAVLGRDPALMVGLMGEVFTIAAWRSEGQTYPPQEAATQLLERHLSGGASPSFDWERDPAMLLEGADPYALFGPDANVVRILLVAGWGNEGQNEAMLFIAQRPDGGYAWHAVLTAFGGFAPESPALSWHREGGIAGFCDDLELYANGNVYARSCKTVPLQNNVHARLAGERLAQLETWVSNLDSFEIEQSTGAVADAMTIRLAFHGTGTGEASKAQVQAMLDFASEVFAELWNVSETDTRYVMALQDTAIRSGPGEGYEALLKLAAGQTALVTGASADGGWWRVICPDDTVGSCWLTGDAKQTERTGVPGYAQLGGGVLATFDVDGERFRVWVTAPTAIQQVLDLQAGRSQANIPTGRILRGPGLSGHNLPWNWHLDPASVEMAELTIELCDGRPSHVNENVDEFVEVVGRYCPWSAQLVEVRDLHDAAQDCPNLSADTRLLVHEAHAYCVLYPATHDAQRPNPQETVIVRGSLLNVQDARLSIEVRDAAGRTAGQVAEERLAEHAGFAIERSTATVDGIEAVVLEPVPGQDLSRQVFVTTGGLLYELTFTPAHPQGRASADMQALYDLVIRSWRFLLTGGRG